MKVDFIIPYRDRGLTSLKNCIDALKSDYTGEIIVIDYGSISPVKMKDVNVIRVDNCHIWNKSHALNIGIKAAKSDYIGTVDCDIVIPPDFMEMTAKVLSENSFVLSNNVRRVGKFTSYDISLAQSTPWKEGEPDYQKAVGGIQIFPKAWAMKYHGYDESLNYWGGMDTYMYLLAQKSKMIVHNLPMTLLHQEHESKKEHNLNNEYEKEVARKAMKGRSQQVEMLSDAAVRKVDWGVY